MLVFPQPTLVSTYGLVRVSGREVPDGPTMAANWPSSIFGLRCKYGVFRYCLERHLLSCLVRSTRVRLALGI